MSRAKPERRASWSHGSRPHISPRPPPDAFVSHLRRSRRTGKHTRWLRTAARALEESSKKKATDGRKGRRVVKAMALSAEEKTTALSGSRRPFVFVLHGCVARGNAFIIWLHPISDSPLVM
ncbi:hypothetical protein NL676_021850 [Syzygium grande]|nr:hypothetical protein NL676_021850 [Syzygium grande]